jgi:SAM-dependent methyltransferase
MKKKLELREAIRKNYAEVASNSSVGGCCSGGCCCDGAPIDVAEASLKIGYSEGDLVNVPLEANMGLGCGNPIVIASIKEGETVLDLGSGGGFDCFLAARQAGETGLVIGVDMTPDMVNLARTNALKSGYPNVEFRLGEIEYLPVADNSVDVIISNCVINLALEKEKVFQEAYRVLKPGGRLAISDIVATAQLPEHIRTDLKMMTGCIAGAEYVENLKSMMEKAGFNAIKLTPKDNSKEIINTWLPEKNFEDYIASYIIEAKKDI